MPEAKTTIIESGQQPPEWGPKKALAELTKLEGKVLHVYRDAAMQGPKDKMDIKQENTELAAAVKKFVVNLKKNAPDFSESTLKAITLRVEYLSRLLQRI